jgi:hypothetical protein
MNSGKEASMKKALIATVLGAVVLVAGAAPERVDADVLEIDIMVSPSTVSLRSEGVWVTVHADIAYGIVACATLTLDGIDVAWTKADSRGDLVAKFELDAVKEILDSDTALLTLSGETRDGTPFVGQDEIRVTR